MGPDLTQPDPKMTRVEVLRHILEPSLKVDEKYRTSAFTLKSGKTVTGMVLEETPARIKVIENPLAKSAPVILDRAEVEERVASPTSIMPKGLLDKLSLEEILDLIAYVIARGDPASPLFQAGNDHAH